jgi:LPS O-antigen subunit length determinant protein (WzzB/FepE family)
MQMKESNPDYLETEMDLKGFFRIIAASKKTVIGITLAATIIAGIYAYQKTPMYEATVLLEIGSYQLENKQNIALDDIPSLIKKLYTKHVLIENSKKSAEQPKIISILKPSKVEGFIEIKSEATSNKLAVEEIRKMVSLLKKKHNIILDDYQQKTQLKLNHVKNKINSILNIEIHTLDEEINKQRISLNEAKDNLVQINVNIKKIEEIDPVLTSLKLTEKRLISDSIFNINLGVSRMLTSKSELETKTLYDLIQEQRMIELLLTPYNLISTKVIGNIITYDYPVRPKRKLMIMLGLIAGLIFSIFLVLIRNTFKEE